MKYTHILIEVVERNISTPKLFPDIASAQKAMMDAFLEVRGLTDEYDTKAMTFDEICKQLAENGVIEDATDITETNAYTDRHGENYDWTIFDLNEIESP